MSEIRYIKAVFKNKLYESNGGEFEKFFNDTMVAKHGSQFTAVQPYGNIGDRKNDGYFHNTGEFYQVYGPNNPSNESTQKYAVKKLDEDFRKLMEHINNGNWQSISKFIFVINTKEITLGPDLAKKRDELQEEFGIPIEIYTSDNLYNDFLLLEKPHMENIIHAEIPVNVNYSAINYEVLQEAITYIKHLNPMEATQDKLIIPDFEDKISFNQLSPKNSKLLDQYNFFYDDIEDYFENTDSEIKEEVKNVLSSLYLQAKENSNCPNEQFKYIYIRAIDTSKASGKEMSESVLSLMSYFFACCDIYEEPPKKEA